MDYFGEIQIRTLSLKNNFDYRGLMLNKFCEFFFGEVEEKEIHENNDGSFVCKIENNECRFHFLCQIINEDIFSVSSNSRESSFFMINKIETIAQFFCCEVDDVDVVVGSTEELVENLNLIFINEFGTKEEKSEAGIVCVKSGIPPR